MDNINAKIGFFKETNQPGFVYGIECTIYKIANVVVSPQCDSGNSINSTN